MPRENPNQNAGVRLLETYNDFSGGINSETSNERLRDNEFPIFENVDMTGRGSARRRYGRVSALTSFPSGTAQGFFFYHRSGQANPDIILAVSGALYLAYATPVSVSNETPTGTGPSYTLANKWVKANSQTVSVSGTTQVYVPDPTDAPIVSVVTSTGTTDIPIGNYTLGYTYKTTTGESKVSPTITLGIAPGKQFQFQPISLPQNVTSINYYMSITQGSSTLGYVANGNGDTIMVSSVPAQGAVNPPANNTATKYTMDYANGGITFLAQPAATPSVSYSYEMKSLPITGLGGGFQTTRQIDACQYGTYLYLATGTQFCQYDGTTVSTVSPYTPSPMEAIWIGLNGLASNPNNYIADTTQTSGAPTVTGIVPQYPQGGVMNEQNNFTAYVQYTTGDGIDYQWQWKLSTDTSWQTGLAFAGTAGTNKTWHFTPTEGAGAYDISVQAKDLTITGTPTSPIYYLMGYKINPTLPAQPPSSSGIQTCNIIQLYWDRILLAGDTSNPGQMYISDLQNPAYFPESNTIDWDMGKREPITALKMFRDGLFVFTKTSIQSLSGQSVDTYDKKLIHSELGAVAGKSVQVINNLIFFLSEEGIMALQPNIYLTYYNVIRMDYPIRSEILGEIDENACSAYWDNQYWLCIPSKSLIYRYYIDYKAWVRDTGTKLNIDSMAHYGNQLYNFTQDSKIYSMDKSVYTDAGEVYTMNVTSRFLDFDEIFVQKKLKRLYVLAQNYSDHNVGLQIQVIADASIVLNPEEGHVFIDSSGNTNWVTTNVDNFEYYAGTTLGSWILGVSPLGNANITVQTASITGSKATRVRIVFKHTQANMCEIFGFAFQFRAKRLR